MQRKSTELTGWQSAIQYIDDDLEQEKSVALQQRQARFRRSRALKACWEVLLGILWAGVIVTAGYMLAVLYMSFHPAIRWDW